MLASEAWQPNLVVQLRSGVRKLGLVRLGEVAFDKVEKLLTIVHRYSRVTHNQAPGSMKAVGYLLANVSIATIAATTL